MPLQNLEGLTLQTTDFTNTTDLTACDENIESIYQKIMVEGDINDGSPSFNDESKDLDVFNVSINESQLKTNYMNSSPSDYEIYDESYDVKDERRPSGKIFGTILHRVFELTCALIKMGKNIDKEEIINQALIESYDDLKEVSQRLDFILSSYKEFLLNKLDEFLSSNLMEEIIKAREIYPEYKFNFRRR